MYPYILFKKKNRVSIKHVEMYLVCYYPYYSTLLFDPTISTSPVYFVAFMLVSVNFIAE